MVTGHGAAAARKTLHIAKPGRPRLDAPSFTVESDVPLPTTPVQYKYPFASMSVDDSFFVACSKGCDQKIWQQRVHGAATRWAVNHGAKGTRPMFTTRQVDGGIRCWRIA